MPPVYPFEDRMLRTLSARGLRANTCGPYQQGQSPPSNNPVHWGIERVHVKERALPSKSWTLETVILKRSLRAASSARPYWLSAFRAHRPKKIQKLWFNMKHFYAFGIEVSDWDTYRGAIWTPYILFQSWRGTT